MGSAALSRHASDALTGQLCPRVFVEVGAEQVARLVEEVRPLEEAGKLGAFLVQLTPAFAPREHELDELAGLVEALAPHKAAIRSMELMMSEVKPRVERALDPPARSAAE